MLNLSLFEIKKKYSYELIDYIRNLYSISSEQKKNGRQCISMKEKGKNKCSAYVKNFKFISKSMIVMATVIVRGVKNRKIFKSCSTFVSQ